MIIGNAGGQSCTASTGVAVTGNAAPYGLAFTDNGVGSASRSRRRSSAMPAASAAPTTSRRGSSASPSRTPSTASSATPSVAASTGSPAARRTTAGRACSAEGRNGVGLRGEGGTDGVVGYGNDAGVRGETETRSAPALRAAAKSGLLALDGAQPAPPASGTFRRGDLLNDKDGSGIWACVTAGSPGVWRKVAGSATAGAFHAIDGGRAYDSRVAGAGGRITSGTNRLVTIPTSLAPGGSLAITYLLTVHDTSGSGGLTVYPANRPRPDDPVGDLVGRQPVARRGRRDQARARE